MRWTSFGQRSIVSLSQPFFFFFSIKSKSFWIEFSRSLFLLAQQIPLVCRPIHDGSKSLNKSQITCPPFGQSLFSFVEKKKQTKNSHFVEYHACNAQTCEWDWLPFALHRHKMATYNMDDYQRRIRLENVFNSCLFSICSALDERSNKSHAKGWHGCK